MSASGRSSTIGIRPKEVSGDALQTQPQSRPSEHSKLAKLTISPQPGGGVFLWMPSENERRLHRLCGDRFGFVVEDQMFTECAPYVSIENIKGV